MVMACHFCFFLFLIDVIKTTFALKFSVRSRSTKTQFRHEMGQSVISEASFHKERINPRMQNHIRNSELRFRIVVVPKKNAWGS